MHLPPKVRILLKRYGLALLLAGLALSLRGVLSFKEGAAIYQLPIAAVVLSAWYGGRGPGLFASLICITGSLYWFVPPVNSFAISPDYTLSLSIFVALCLLLSEFSAGRRRAEHRLRATEERFRALLQFSFDVYWETDAEHRFTRQEFSRRLTEAPAGGAEIGKTAGRSRTSSPTKRLGASTEPRWTRTSHFGISSSRGLLPTVASAMCPSRDCRCSTK